MLIKDLIKSEALKFKSSKRHIAKHTKSAKTLEELSNDSDRYVLFNVAWNRNCSAETLKKLSNDSDWNVRCNVAYNPNCPIETLEKFSNDSCVSVRGCVTWNQNCPVKTLEKLSKDPDSYVRCNANKSLNRIRGAQS